MPETKRILKADNWTLFYFLYLWALQKMSKNVKIKSEKDIKQLF